MQENKIQPVKLKNGKWTFKNPNGTLWSDIYGEKGVFKDASDFREGLAIVYLKDGTHTYVDTNCNLFKNSFCFQDNFYNGVARVQLKDGSWTFVDKNDKLMKQRFKDIFDFYCGFARVRLFDDSWTFVDKKANFFKEKFEFASSFYKGLAVVVFDGERKNIDKYQNLWDDNYATLFRAIYEKPEHIYEIEESLAFDKKFFRTALSVIKQKLEDMREEMSEEEVDEYRENLNEEIKCKFAVVVDAIRYDIKNTNQDKEH